MSKSSRKARLEKPRPDFPLFPHDPTHPNRSRWAKKIKGFLHYFGKVADDPKGEKALQLWLEQKDDLLAGRKPRPKVDGLTIDALVNSWLHSKKARLDARELSPLTWQGYTALAKTILDALGRTRLAADLRPEDFAKLRATYSKRWGPQKLATAITHTRGIFRWAYQEGLLAVPQRFGEGFSKPAAKTMRQARNERGPRMFEPTQLRTILDMGDVQTRALVLLGINGAIGPTDAALLPISAIDFDGGWLNLPRQKTAVPRRIPLWPESLNALREVLAHRPAPKRGNEELVFLSSQGSNYSRAASGAAIGKLFRTAAAAAGVTGRTFYDLRRSFQTIADNAKDPVAVSAIMGHAPKGGDMAAIYRQSIDDSRLLAVVAVVHDWLFGQKDGTDEDRLEGRQDADNARQASQASTPIQRAVVRCLRAIEAAEGPDKETLRSVWNESEISLALQGEYWATMRFLRQWGDHVDDRPRLRVVG